MPKFRRHIRILFLVLLAFSFLAHSGNVADAAGKKCDAPASGSGVSGKVSEGPHACCCCAAEERTACSGLSSGCEGHSPESSPLSVSNAPRSSVNFAALPHIMAPASFSRRQRAAPLFGHEIIYPINLNLLC